MMISLPIFRLYAKQLRCAMVSLGLLMGAQSAVAGIDIVQWQLGNGAKVYWVHNAARPMVDIQVDFDAGSRRDPPLKAGLAAATSELMRWGVREQIGSAALTASQVNEAWADLGAEWATHVVSDRASVTLRTLTTPATLEKAVALGARHLGAPLLASTDWERLQSRSIASLRESLTRPGTIARRAFLATAFAGHPYGVLRTQASLAAISSADIDTFFANYYRACDAKVTIVGDVNRETAHTIATQLLALMPAAASCAPLPSIPEVPAITQAVTKKIPFPSAQTHIYVGAPAVSMSDQDLFALTLGNHILGGGGFGSRLMQEVREKRGLAYGIYSAFQPGTHLGEFMMNVQTRPDQAEKALSVMGETLANFLQNGVTADEVEAAKANLIGGFSLRLDGNAAILSSVASIAWYGRPLNHLSNWTKRMNDVTVEDVRRAFGRVVSINTLVTVVVGEGDAVSLAR